jgi:hypothetical protein
MKMEPKGRIPETGMMKSGEAYHGAAGMGLGREIMRQAQGEGRRAVGRVPWDAIDTTRSIASGHEMSSKDCADDCEWEGNKEPDSHHFDDDHGRNGIDRVVVDGDGVED